MVTAGRAERFPGNKARSEARPRAGCGLQRVRKPGPEPDAVSASQSRVRLPPREPDAVTIDLPMLSITTKSPYALDALVELQLHGDSGPVPIAELARRRDIPVQFLEQLFATLRRAGVLRSQRGVGGGYTFARPASEITVLEVVELLDGPVGRGARGLFADAAQAARSVLSSWTIADVAEAESRAAGAPMYHI